MIREFGRYVADTVRNRAYDAAIARTVRQGDVVADLGTGFGLLAMLAARAGARRVYAVEQQRYIELAAAIGADNGLADRIVYLQGNSMEIELPERVDVIVSEIFGAFALEEFVVGFLADARRRWLKPGGRIIPADCTLWVAPVELPAAHADRQERLGGPWRDVLGFDLERLRHAVVRNELLPYTAHRLAPPDRLLGPPQVLEHFDFNTALDIRRIRDLALPITRPGRIDGVLGYFSSNLAPSVTLSTAPDQPPTHWSQMLFHLWPPARARAGDVLGVRLGFGGENGWTFMAGLQ